jgi:hypothetical protein
MRAKSVMRTFPIVLLAVSLTLPSFAVRPWTRAAPNGPTLRQSGRLKDRPGPNFGDAQSHEVFPV